MNTADVASAASRSPKSRPAADATVLALTNPTAAAPPSTITTSQHNPARSATTRPLAGVVLRAESLAAVGFLVDTPE
ncbi:hypothetical protein GCM10009565_30530 [Amycolatopsis albidoflavus]